MTSRLRVASDVGGTFTDNLAYDAAEKRITVAKVPTTPENRALGTVRGLRRALEAQGRSGGDVVYVGHGMTTATNALLQRSGARIAFITNEGFRDLLLIGRQNRPSLYDIRKTRPEPLVRREDCHTVRGRLDPAGNEIVPLDEDGVRRIAERLRADGVAAVAICFLHAYANPAHERRARAILTEALPGVPVCLSTDILAEFREYERASTVALNAYVLPVIEGYLASLTELLADPADGLGLAEDVPVMVMEAAGGLMTVASAREKPVHTVLSGPAGGVVGERACRGAVGLRRHHRDGHGRHQHRHQPGARRPPAGDARGGARRHPDPHPGHRHQRDRRRRRVDRVDRRGRRAAGRTAQRRGGAGSGLLRPRRRGADRHRRQSRARPARRRYAGSAAS